MGCYVSKCDYLGHTKHIFVSLYFASIFGQKQESLISQKIGLRGPILAKNGCKILVDIKKSLVYPRGTHFDA